MFGLPVEVRRECQPVWMVLLSHLWALRTEVCPLECNSALTTELPFQPGKTLEII